MVPSPGVCPFTTSFSLRGIRSSNTASATGAPGIIVTVITRPLSLRYRSVQEVPFPREHHRETTLVGALDDLLVADRAAGLQHHRDPGVGRGIDTIGERVERVGRGGAAAGATGVLLRRDLTRLHTVLLPRADADGLAVLHEHDRVRLDVADDSPRQLRVAPLALGGRALRDDAPVVPGGSEVGSRLHEEAPRDLAEVEPGGLGCRRFEDARVLALLAQRLDGALLVTGRDHEVGLRARDHALHGRRVDGAVERADPAERRALVALQRELVRGREVSRDCDA